MYKTESFYLHYIYSRKAPSRHWFGHCVFKICAQDVFTLTHNAIQIQNVRKNL